MLRLSTNMKLRDYFFIPPLGRIDDSILNSMVSLSKSDGTVINLTVSEYLLNERGVSTSPAADGNYYSEVIDNGYSGELFRSLATKYIPAGASFSQSKPKIFISMDSKKTSIQIISFEDNTSSITDDRIASVITDNNPGFYVQGQLASVKSLHGVRMFTLTDGTEIVWKPGRPLNYVRLYTDDGTYFTKEYNPKKAFLFWELVDRNVPDTDIVNFLSNTLNLVSEVDQLTTKLDYILQKVTEISGRVETIMYDSDRTRTAISTFADKMVDQKKRIDDVDKSVWSAEQQLMRTIEGVDAKIGSYSIKIEDMSKSVDGLKRSLSSFDTLPSKVDNLLNNQDNSEILDTLNAVKLLISTENDQTKTYITENIDKIITTVTVSVNGGSRVANILSFVNLLLQLLNMSYKKGIDHE